MSRFWMLACACAAGLALTAAPARAENPAPPAKKTEKGDPTEQLLAKLEQESQLREGININEVPLIELLHDFSKRYGVTFVINTDAFKAVGLPDVGEAKPTALATQLRGLPLRQVLNLTLESMGATYLVRRNTIEIVPVHFAAKLTKSATTEGEDSRPHLNEPLVSVIFKEKPLNEAVAKVAEMYDLTITVATQAGDAKAGFVTARILNQPADKAIELLALQCDLRVVRRGTAYMLTSKDHANELFGEKLDKERQKIEVEQLRRGTAKPPEKAPEPKQPEPKM
jgi:type II secretory pathway component GspD/PulD (secretin)